ncbi:prominin-1-like isoform X2 [Apostichopus japonicus]|uniref:prominin-1-like isoform X2 n=1 Tax=Stichopus japonicus TaxID=307972 RepID=UPI003AB2516E
MINCFKRCVWTTTVFSFFVIASLLSSCRANEDHHDKQDFNWLSDASQYNLVNNTIDNDWRYNFLVETGEYLVRLLVPESFPWGDTVTSLMSDGADMDTLLQELIMFELPLLIISGILMLLAICLPIVGICFCLCRCCGNCGGTRKDEEISSLNRCPVYVMSVILTVICILIGICTFLDKPVQSKLVESSFDLGYTVLYTAYDIETFSDNIVKDLNQLAYDDFDGFTDEIMDRLDGADEEISDPLLRETYSHLDAIADHLDNFLNELELFTLENNTFGEINETINRILTGSEDLEIALDNVAANLTDIKTDCLADPIRAGLGVCDSLPDPNELEVSLDLTQLTSISDRLDPLLIFDSTNSTITVVFDLLNEINQSLSAVPEVIQNQTKEFQSTVNSTLLSIGRSIKTSVDESVEILESFDVQEMMQTEMIENELWKAELDSYMNYEFILRAALGGFLLVLLSLAGLCFGCVGYDSNKPPSQQSGITNCGGKMSMCAAVWAFLIAFIICFGAAILFLVGSNLTLVCDDLQDLTIIEEVVDNPALWNGEHPLASISGNANMTFYSLLEQCGEDDTIAGILGLTDMLDTDSLDIRGEIPDLDELAHSINQSFGEMGFSNVDISSQIQRLNGQFLPANVTEQISTIKNATAFIDVKSIANDLDSQAAAVRSSYPDMASSLEGLATKLRNIQDEIVEGIANDTVLLQDQLSDMNSSINTLMGETSPILTSVDDIMEFVQIDALLLVVETLETFIDDIVTVAENFTNESIERVKNDIGRCGIVRLIYDSLVNGFCDGFMAAITLSWLCCIVFSICLIPFICLNVRIAKYYLPTSTNQPHYYLPSNKVTPV